MSIEGFDYKTLFSVFGVNCHENISKILTYLKFWHSSLVKGPFCSCLNKSFGHFFASRSEWYWHDKFELVSVSYYCQDKGWGGGGRGPLPPNYIHCSNSRQSSSKNYVETISKWIPHFLILTCAHICPMAM